MKKLPWKKEADRWRTRSAHGMHGAVRLWAPGDWRGTAENLIGEMQWMTFPSQRSAQNWVEERLTHWEQRLDYFFAQPVCGTKLLD